jgi:hypothetical protein
LDDITREYVRRATECRLEAESRAVERMLILPGNLGARLYEWTDAAGYHCAVQLADTIEHMTIDHMPFGDKPF